MKFIIFLEERKKPNLNCPECEEIFCERSEWVVHNEKNHGKFYPKYEKNHACYVCGTTDFRSGKALLEHCLSVHEVAKPYQCEECFKIFSYKKLLRFHIRNVHEIAESGHAGGKFSLHLK